MSAVDIAPGKSAMFAATGPDPVVNVPSGPVTIFVIQNGRVCATLEWQTTGGSITVPLKAVVSGPKPVFVGVMPGLISKAVADLLHGIMCPHCISPNHLVPCCP